MAQNRFAPLAFGIIVLLTACGDGGNTNSTAITAAAAAPLSINSVGKAEGVDVTVTKVTTPKGIKYGPQAKSGETLVIVGYTIKNTADKPLSLLERPAFALIDAQGQRYNPDDFITASAGVEVAAANSFVADINPNTSIDGRVAWKLDATAFDRNTWKLVVAGDPQLTFALK